MSFERSLHAVEADRRRFPWLVTSALALLVGWAAWMCLAEVPVRESSETAQLEAAAVPHPVQARVAGRVIAVHLGLGRAVTDGEVLVELDTTELQREIDAATSRRDGIGAQLAQLEQTIAGERRVLDEREHQLGIAVAEQRALASKADTEEAAATLEAERLAKLLEKGVVSAAEYEAARAKDKQLHDQTSSQHLEVQRLESETSVERAKTNRTILDLDAQRVALGGQQREAADQVAALEARLEATRIRAPIAGVLGDTATIGVGAFLAEGANVATVVPDGQLHIVAEMLASGAAGRVKPGQLARLRLDGFSWTQYGSVPARVERVASQPRDGKLRVELLVLPGANPAIPLQHGLPGRVDVEVERVSPARLTLRFAGHWMDE